MKNKKREYMLFSFYDRTGIEAHMEHMAMQGWMLEKITNFFWHYRKIEPKQIHFSVTYFPKASAFDPEPSENQEIFRDFCAHSGWELAASSAQMEIYYNEAEDPVPIITDALIELETIHKSAKKTIIVSNIITLALGILQEALILFRFFNNILDVNLQNTNLFLSLCWLCVILVSSAELLNYYKWYKKAKTAAEIDGSFIETKSTKTLQKIVLFILLLGMCWWMFSLKSFLYVRAALIGITYAFTVIFLINSLKSVLKKKKVPAQQNRMITMISSFVLSFGLLGIVTFLLIKGAQNGMFEERTPYKTYDYLNRTYKIYHDELPLYLEDLIDIDYEDYSYEKEAAESILLQKTEVVQSAPYYMQDMPEMSYSIIKIKASFLYDACFMELFQQYDEWYEDRNYQEIDASPWNAKSAYQLCYDGQLEEKYLICYEDYFIELNLYGFELLPEHIEIISEKLKN